MYRRNNSQPSVTVEQLRQLLMAPSNGLMVFPSRPYDEVYPGIIIGDAWTARDTVILSARGVGAVLNSACGVGQPYLVETDSEYYRRRQLAVRFMPIRAIDADWYRLEDWFQPAADFIHNSRRHGKVLVHCVQGLSRSATLVIAYLMIKQNMSVQQALKTVRAKREIFPNDGFLLQLIRLNEQLNASKKLKNPWA